MKYMNNDGGLEASKEIYWKRGDRKSSSRQRDTEGWQALPKSCKEPTLMSMFVLFCFWKSWTFQYDKDQSVRFSEQFLHAVPIILECFLTYLSMVFHIFPMFFVVFCCWSHPGWSSPIQSLQLLHSRGGGPHGWAWWSWQGAPRWGPQPSKQR